MNTCGLNFIWIFQENNILNVKKLKLDMKTIILDQFKQNWIAMIENSPKGLCYRLYKDTFGFESYLDLLNNRNRITLCKFRTCNHKLPIETGRWHRIGDEFHFILECSALLHKRNFAFGKYCCKQINTLKFKYIFQNCNVTKMRKLCNFIRIITNRIGPH